MIRMAEALHAALEAVEGPLRTPGSALPATPAVAPTPGMHYIPARSPRGWPVIRSNQGTIP
jgi:hypothetical protein